MQKRSEQGFTLLETLTALLILMVCMSFMFPVYTKTIQEREAIRQKEDALSILNEALDDWTNNSKEQPSVRMQSGVPFHLEWILPSERHTQLCVKWQGSNKRSQQLCGEAVRKE